MSEASSIDTAILGELTESQQDLRDLHTRMRGERKLEQVEAAAERQRLEDILLMCAEYEKQMEREVVTRETVNMETIARETGNSRNSMTKIKTNGSLTKLASPTQSHKDMTFDYKWKRNSTSSTEEDTGSENGTIKRRPYNGLHSPVGGSTLSASPNYDNAFMDNCVGSKRDAENSVCIQNTLNGNTQSGNTPLRSPGNVNNKCDNVDKFSPGGLSNGVDVNRNGVEHTTTVLHMDLKTPPGDELGNPFMSDWRSQTLPSGGSRMRQLMAMKAMDTGSLGRGGHLGSQQHDNLVSLNHDNLVCLNHKNLVSLNHKNLLSLNHKNLVCLNHKNLVGLNHENLASLNHENRIKSTQNLF